MADVVLSVTAVGVFIGAVLALVRIALASERRRADDWRTIAQTATAANKVMAANIDKLVATVEEQTSTQRQMMALLQQVVDDRRSGA